LNRKSRPSATRAAALFALSLGLFGLQRRNLGRGGHRLRHGRETVRNEVSTYYLSLEIRGAWDGMQIAIPPKHWRMFATQSDEDFDGNPPRNRRSDATCPTTKNILAVPKKKPPQKTKYQNGGHVSTAKLYCSTNATLKGLALKGFNTSLNRAHMPATAKITPITTNTRVEANNAY